MWQAWCLSMLCNAGSAEKRLHGVYPKSVIDGWQWDTSSYISTMEITVVFWWVFLKSLWRMIIGESWSKDDSLVLSQDKRLAHSSQLLVMTKGWGGAMEVRLLSGLLSWHRSAETQCWRCRYVRTYVRAWYVRGYVVRASNGSRELHHSYYI